MQKLNRKLQKDYKVLKLAKWHLSLPGLTWTIHLIMHKENWCTSSFWLLAKILSIKTSFQKGSCTINMHIHAWIFFWYSLALRKFCNSIETCSLIRDFIYANMYIWNYISHIHLTNNWMENQKALIHNYWHYWTWAGQASWCT